MKKKLYTVVFIAVLLCGNAVAGDIHIRGSYSQGYIETTDFNYLVNDSEDGSFQFNELNVNFSTIINDKFHVGFGLSSRNLGRLYDNEIAVNWAYGDYHYKDYLGVRMGRVKTPLGFYNETREMDMFRTSIILPNTYPEAYRDFWSFIDGVGIYGTAYVPYIGTFIYQANVGTQDAPAYGGTKSYMNERLSALDSELGSPYFVDKNWVVDLKWETFIPGLVLAKSHLNIGTVEAESVFFGTTSGMLYVDDLEINFSSLKYTYENFSFVSEYMTMEMTYTLQTDSGLTLLDSLKVFVEAWYFNPTYRITDWLEIGAYYSEFYPTRTERSEEYLKDFCVSFRFDVNDNWIVKLEYHGLKGIGYVPEEYNSDKEWGTKDYSDENWSMFAAKITFNF